MKTRKLGSHGPEISVVGYGAWEAGGQGWGPNPPDDQVIDSMHAAFASGINWVDTAEIYGRGRSEELVADALDGHDDVLVFTKVAAGRSGSGDHPEGVRAGAEKSLGRLRRDVIDLYQLHWPNHGIPFERTWEAMASLVEDGLVKHIGVSNFDREGIERCEKIAHVDSLQPQFSLLTQKGRDDLLPFCEENGTGVICYGPLAYGLLTGSFDANTTFGDDDWRSDKQGSAYHRLFKPGVFERNLGIVDRLRPVADRLGISLAQLALAWVVHQRGVTGAIAGSRNPDHVRDNAGAGDVSLETKDLDEIDSIAADAAQGR